MEKKEIEELKKLIKKGFDLDLISFELEIPIEELYKIKEELDNERKKNTAKRENTKKEKDGGISNSYAKLQEMRSKYKKLYYNENKSIEQSEVGQSEKEQELINSVIAEIEKIIEGISEKSESEKRESIIRISKRIDKISNYNLTIEQIEKINQLMRNEELVFGTVKNADNINVRLKKCRRLVLDKMCEAIDVEIVKIEDIEELNRLKRRIAINTANEKSLIINSLIAKIDAKIYRILQEKARSRKINNVPENIERIVADIENGVLDIETENEIINQEIQKKLANNSQNKFSLNAEQERIKILNQIKKLIREGTNGHKLKNPETAIVLLQSLCKGDAEEALSVVIENLINQNDIEKAKEVYKGFARKNHESGISSYMKIIKAKIRNAEIGDMVIRAINMSGDVEEQAKAYELIEDGIKKGNISLSMVPLGKSQDGMKDISLKDVWPDERQIGKDR